MEGTQLGPYRISRELGSGGMGRVWLAEAKERGAVPAGTRVALKLVHPHLLSVPGFFKRFLREAEIGRAVAHPNVVRCHDCDQLLVDGRTHAFLVMEYVEGQTLRSLLEELERVPEELCRHIGREVAKGLAAIHVAGVIHRDLKPENVLITEDHVVKIMDLGVARLADEAIRLSQTGVFVGSPHYAAPEQFLAGGEDVDGRADLHALGVVLYELAAGAHPYQADDVPRVMRRILDEEPRRLGAMNPQLSPYFEELVHLLLEKDREARFASAAELALVLTEGEKSAWWMERAKALRIQTKRPLRRVRIPRETAVYGRDGELARLKGLYEQAKSGDGRVVLIEGEAGIGKTRLVDELVARLQADGEDVNFLFGSYPPGGAATASGAWSTAYREHFGAEGLEEALAPYLTVTPILIPAFAALLKGEPPPKGEEELTKDSLQTVFVHATRALAAERPTIVLIEDLHFAPEEGRAMFASLALAVPEHPILLVGTSRPGLPEDWRANLERLDQASRLELSRLGAKDLGRLLIDAFHSERLATELGLKIATKSDGNPFFTFEIIRGLREGQFITKKPDGTWVTTKVIRDIEVPSSVLDLVNARVASLSEEERDLLDVAACCGFEFDPGLVAQAAGVARIPALKCMGQIERRHRLIRAAGRRCVFDHHQVQEALYGSLLADLREAYHAAIGDALAEGHPEPDGSVAVDLCEHYLKGARGQKALPHLESALEYLAKCYLNDQAITLADRALTVPGLLEGAARVEVLLKKNDRLEFLGRRDAQAVVLEEVRELARESGALAARAEQATGVLCATQGRYEEAREHFERTLAMSREIGDRRGEAHARGNLGNVFMRQGRYEDAQEHIGRHLAISREVGDRQGEAHATGNLGAVVASQGPFEAGQEHFERSLAMCREIGDRRGEAHATINLGSVFTSQGHHEEAREHLDRALAMSREIGNRMGEARTTMNLGGVFFGQRRPEEAREHFERSLAMSREIGDRNGEAVALVNLGPAWLSLGDRARAKDVLQASLSLCREIRARYPEGYARFGLASLADEEGDAEAGLSGHEEALALRRAIGHGDGVAESLLEVADLSCRAGDEDGARAALEEAISLLQKQGDNPKIALAEALRAGLPGGDAAAALTALEAAGEPGNTPRTRFLLWQATGDRAHLTEARRLLDEALSKVPEERHQAMLTNIRLHREIVAAVKEEGI